MVGIAARMLVMLPCILLVSACKDSRLVIYPGWTISDVENKSIGFKIELMEDVLETNFQTYDEFVLEKDGNALLTLKKVSTTITISESCVDKVRVRKYGQRPDALASVIEWTREVVGLLKKQGWKEASLRKPVESFPGTIESFLGRDVFAPSTSDKEDKLFTSLGSLVATDGTEAWFSFGQNPPNKTCWCDLSFTAHNVN